MFPEEEKLGSPAEQIVDDAVNMQGTPEGGESGYVENPAPTGGMSAPYPPGYTWQESATGVAPEMPTGPAEEPSDEIELPLAEAAPPKKKKKKKSNKPVAPEASVKEKKLAQKTSKRSKEKKWRSSLLAAKLLVFTLFGVAVAVQREPEPDETTDVDGPIPGNTPDPG